MSLFNLITIPYNFRQHITPWAAKTRPKFQKQNLSFFSFFFRKHIGRLKLKYMPVYVYI